MARRIPVAVLVDDNTTTVAATGKRIKLWGIVVTTALSAHAVPIKDGAGNVVTALSASLAVGAAQDFWGMELDGLIVDPNDAGTGAIILVIEHVG